ncbi:hypothetical protein [Marinobacterium iners]|uniref:Uncharacterized protein n=1 Tax=Marinobacterium iners DSM 11526 TaxID=1122198 RepID=A0A1H4GS03_9GAMM|nr:hypothetical protein [Marinobacterium iners]SEB12121.1 hypothetical protein SAMN02745729_11945 [Marinobacterium iners DSM 11526]
MDSHGDAGRKIVPYQKGLLTISIAILIYVLGKGELSPSLSITIVGLTLHRPEVLEYVAMGTWAWYMWKFVVHNSFAFNSSLLKIAEARTLQIHFGSFKKAMAEEKRLQNLEPYQIHVARVRQAFWWEFTFDVEDPNTGGVSREPTPRTGPLQMLGMKLHTILIWVLRDESCSDEYLPCSVGVVAGALGLVYTAGMI